MSPGRETASQTGSASAARTGPKPLTFAEKKELEGILDTITTLEQEVATIEARLNEPGLYAGNPDVARDVRAAHGRAVEALREKTSRWEELEARRSGA